MTLRDEYPGEKLIFEEICTFLLVVTANQSMDKQNEKC